MRIKIEIIETCRSSQQYAKNNSFLTKAGNMPKMSDQV